MATSNILSVSAQSSTDSRAMGICQLDTVAVQALQFGRRVNIMVVTGDGASVRLRGKPTLRALTKFFSAIHRAVQEQNANNGGPIDTIVLPNHDIPAYNKLFGWMYASITAEKLTRINRVNVRARDTYDEMRAIASDLGVGWVVKVMDNRLHAMARASGASGW